MLFLLSFCCSVLSYLFFTQVQNLYKYRPIYLYTYIRIAPTFISLSFNNLRLYLAHLPLFTALGSTGIAPFCVHTYALTCTAKR